MAGPNLKLVHSVPRRSIESPNPDAFRFQKMSAEPMARPTVNPLHARRLLMDLARELRQIAEEEQEREEADKPKPCLVVTPARDIPENRKSISWYIAKFLVQLASRLDKNALGVTSSGQDREPENPTKRYKVAGYLMDRAIKFNPVGAWNASKDVLREELRERGRI